MWIGGHLSAIAAIPHLDFGRALTECRHGNVNRGIATTDNDDMRADLWIFSVAHGRQEIHAADNEILFVAFNTQRLGILHAGCQQGRIESFFLEFLCILDGMVHVDFDAEIFDDVDFCIQFGFRQTIIWNAVAHDATRLGTFIEDFDVMTFLCQIVGGGQTGRTAADDGDFLAGRSTFLKIRA